MMGVSADWSKDWIDRADAAVANTAEAAAEITRLRAEVERLQHEVASAGALRLRMEAHKTTAQAAETALSTLRDRVEAMTTVLEQIAELKGKTLISMEHGQPYSIGAHAAFEAAADLARAAHTLYQETTDVV